VVLKHFLFLLNLLIFQLFEKMMFHMPPRLIAWRT